MQDQVEALRQLAINGDRDLGGKLGDVVLASPDIDVDVFKSQMRRYGRAARKPTLFNRWGPRLPRHATIDATGRHNSAASPRSACPCYPATAGP